MKFFMTVLLVMSLFEGSPFLELITGKPTPNSISLLNDIVTPNVSKYLIHINQPQTPTWITWAVTFSGRHGQSP